MLKMTQKIGRQKPLLTILFLLILIVTLLIVAFNVMSVEKHLRVLPTEPDAVFYGATYTPPEGEYPFIAYETTGDLAADIEHKAEGAKAHPLVIRSLFNYFDDKTGYGFEGKVYGMPQAPIERLLGRRLLAGTLPRASVKEAVVGKYFADRFGLHVGDPIPQTITLSTTWDNSDIDAYTVAGILDEHVSKLFVGSAVINLESYEDLEGDVFENAVLVEFTKAADRRKVFERCNALATEHNLPEGQNYADRTRIDLVFNVVKILAVIIAAAGLLTWLTLRLQRSFASGTNDATTLPSGSAVRRGLVPLFVLATLTAALLTWLATAGFNQYLSDFYGFQAVAYLFNFKSIAALAVTSVLLFLLMTACAALFKSRPLQ